MNAINTHIKLYKLGYINLQYMYAMNTCAVSSLYCYHLRVSMIIHFNKFISAVRQV